MRERGSAGGRTSQLTTIRPPGSWIPPGGPVASHVQLFAWGEALLMLVGWLQEPVLSVDMSRMGMRLFLHATSSTVPGCV